MSNEKKAGLIISVSAWIFCEALFIPLGVVGTTWLMLLHSLWSHGWTATMPDGYAYYLLTLLVTLTIVSDYVGRLHGEARGRVFSYISRTARGRESSRR